MTVCALFPFENLVPFENFYARKEECLQTGNWYSQVMFFEYISNFFLFLGDYQPNYTLLKFRDDNLALTFSAH